MADSPLVGLDPILFQFELSGTKLVDRLMPVVNPNDPQSLEASKLTLLGFLKHGLIVRNLYIESSGLTRICLFIQGIGESIPGCVFSFACQPQSGTSQLPSLHRPSWEGLRIPSNCYLYLGLDKETNSIWDTWNILAGTGIRATTWDDAKSAGIKPLTWDSETPSLYKFNGSLTGQRLI